MSRIENIYCNVLLHYYIFLCMFVYHINVVCPNRDSLRVEMLYTFFLKYSHLWHISIHTSISIPSFYPSVYLSICFVCLTVMQFVQRDLLYQPDTFQSRTNSVLTPYLQSHNGNCPHMHRPPPLFTRWNPAVNIHLLIMEERIVAEA